MRFFPFAVVILLFLGLACSGVPAEAKLFTPEEFVQFAMANQSQNAWAALDPECRDTIDRAAFDDIVQRFWALATDYEARNGTKGFFTLDEQTLPDGRVQRRYHFDRDWAYPRPEILITVPLGPSGKACGLSFDHRGRTSMRDRFEHALQEDDESWALPAGGTITIYEIVERAFEGEGKLVMIIKAEPMRALENPSLALSIGRGITDVAAAKGWRERLQQRATEQGLAAHAEVGVRFVDVETFHSYTVFVPWDAP